MYRVVQWATGNVGRHTIAGIDARPDLEAVEDLKGFVRAGINVVASGPVFLQYPYGVMPDAMIDPIVSAAEEGGASLFVNGIDPGFANDWLPLVLTSISERIEEVRCMEIFNYATYNQPMVLSDIMGFGRPIDDVPLLLTPGVLTTAWWSVVRQIAKGLEIDLDSIEEIHERLLAPDTFEVAAGDHNTAGLKATAMRLVNAVPAVVEAPPGRLESLQ